MQIRHVGRSLLGLGLFVGLLASVGLLVGFEPSRLPPALLDIAAYKLTFGAALALLAVGAVLLRRGRREVAPAAPHAPAELPGESSASALDAGVSALGGDAVRGTGAPRKGAASHERHSAVASRRTPPPGSLESGSESD